MALENLKKHPKEMFPLTLTEMSQRFAFWGVANLLVLFLTNFHQISPVKATHIFGLFTAIAFLLPMFGGYIGDRISHIYPIFIGLILGIIGSIGLATMLKSLLYPSLLLISLGTTLFTPSIYAILGKLYSSHPKVREAGFSLYYASVNLGVFIAMLSLGALMRYVGWKSVFICTAAIQLLGIFPFIKVLRMRPELKEKMYKKASQTQNKIPMHKHEKDRLIVIAILCMVSLFFWLAYNQMGSSFVLFIEHSTNRAILDFTLPTPWILSIEPLFLLILVYPLSSFYLKLKKIHKDPSPIKKTALSFIFMALAFLILTLAKELIKGKISFLYMGGSLISISFAELLIAPIGLSLITHLSPKRFTAALVGMWYFTVGVGYYLGGYVAGLMPGMSKAVFFSMFIYPSIALAALLFLLSKKMARMRHMDHL